MWSEIYWGSSLIDCELFVEIANSFQSLDISMIKKCSYVSVRIKYDIFYSKENIVLSNENFQMKVLQFNKVKIYTCSKALCISNLFILVIRLKKKKLLVNIGMNFLHLTTITNLVYLNLIDSFLWYTIVKQQHILH